MQLTHSNGHGKQNGYHWHNMEPSLGNLGHSFGTTLGLHGGFLDILEDSE